MNLKLLLIILIGLLFIGCTPTKTEAILKLDTKGHNKKTITYLYASQLGKATLDTGERGGNPFASAFIELLSHRTLDFNEFKMRIVALTLKKSKNFQKPDVISNNLRSWQFLLPLKMKRKIALIFVYSNYSYTRMNSLQGTKNDLDRVSRKLLEVGFKIKTIIDPNKRELNKILKEFSKDSLKADVAIIYTTGHGFEMEGETYLLPNNYVYSFRKKELLKYSIPIKKIGNNMFSPKLNLLFYGGCRTSILK